MPPTSRVGDLALVPADGHGCPACPHVCIGPGTDGSCDVLVNGLKVLRQGDPGIHAPCCGPNKWNTAKGSPTVLVNSLPVIRQGDPTTHCGGSGQMIMGSCNVIIGDSYCGSYSPVPTAAKAILNMLKDLLKDGKSSMPGKPSLPSPNLPEKPSKPSLPSKPGKPSLPDKPGKPSLPDKPDKPSLPDKPDKPSLPDKPEVPELPEKPDKPQPPAKPEKPGKPETSDKCGTEGKESGWDIKLDNLGGGSVSVEPKPRWSHDGNLEHKPETFVGVQLGAEKDLLKKYKKEGEDSLQWKKFGEGDNTLKIATAEAKLATGYKFDAVKGEHELTVISLSGKAALVEGKLSDTIGGGLIKNEVGFEALSVAGQLTGPTVKVNKDGLETKMGVGVEANLVKVNAKGTLNITPKTVYDNTLGKAVGAMEGLFREPKLNKLPESWDHGLVLGAEGEAGIGAAAKAEGAFKATKDFVGFTGEAKVGAGPMAGLKLIIGVK
ncbi:MAG: PAAR domain-containing protein [Myxococcota bacterium]